MQVQDSILELAPHMQSVTLRRSAATVLAIFTLAAVHNMRCSIPTVVLDHGSYERTLNRLLALEMLVSS